MKSLDLNLSELVEIYNHVPQVLSRKAVKVSVTEDSIITKSNQSLFMANAKNGNYWVIATEDKTYWLLPKGNLRIDTFNYETVKSLFHCDGYQPEVSQFTLIQPAKVSLTSSGTEWKLEEMGRLDFGKTPVPELESELKWATEKSNQLQYQLEQLTQERNQLQSQLKELTEKSQLERLKFNKQMQQQQFLLNQAVTERERLLSQMQKQLNDKFTTIETELKEIKQRLSSNHQDNLLKSNIKPVESVKTNVNQQTKTHVNQPQQVSPKQSAIVPMLNWVSSYNQNPDFLAEQVTEVSETEESINQRRSGVNQPTVFEKSRKGRGYLWILTGKNLGERENYLVPKGGLKINEFNFKTVQSLFEFNGEPSGTPSKFILVKPAVVFPLDNEKWQLAELGILQFESIDSLNQVEITPKFIELPTNQYTQLSSQNQSSLKRTSTIAHPLQTSISENFISSDELLVADYNKAPFVLAEEAIKVSENKDSLNQRLLLGSSKPPIFEKNSYGSYWIFTRGDKNYLLPSIHIKFNELILNTIQPLFECRENTLGKSTSEFKLVKPAIVSLVAKETWQLVEPGIIQF